MRWRQFSSKILMKSSSDGSSIGNLVGNAAQERFVGQRRGIEVGGKHRQHVERHLELLAGVQRQEVHAALERHDPAVEELVGPDALTAEVVHQEHAAVGAQLQRRLVEPRQRVEGEVELIERQLAAHHDDRTPDAHPAAVARRRGNDAGRVRLVLVEPLVVDRVEHRDDVPVDVDGVRHVHVAADRPAEAFGNHRLAVAGRPVEEERLVGVGGRPELLEHSSPMTRCEKPLRRRSRSMKPRAAWSAFICAT